MLPKLDHPDILTTVKPFAASKRNDSAALLIWYLVNYYRLDETTAVDAVCDTRGDKGVDGIFINESEGTIDVFQATILQSAAKTIGDTSLKEFYGTLSQFSDRKTLEATQKVAGNSDFARLLARENVSARMQDLELRGIFLANVDIDANGQAFVDTKPEMQFIGKSALLSSFVSDSRVRTHNATAEFDIRGISVSEYVADQSTKAIILPVKATELVQLSGIEDQSLFAFNVREALGSTQVNRDIVASIRKGEMHRYFPLFHNGITVIAKSVNIQGEKLAVVDYYVVNGCQSLTALYRNRAHLTDNLRVLVKVIEVDVDAPLSSQITAYSNNQNAVKPRDFKSNNPIQIRLQNEIARDYGEEFYFEIKRGETDQLLQPISNELAGLNIMAFDLKEPWATHRTYRVFEDKFVDIFTGPGITSHRIVALHILMVAISKRVPDIKNQLVAKYGLTRYFILFVTRQILEDDEQGNHFIKSPQDFIKDLGDRKKFLSCIGHIIDDIVIDINAQSEEWGDDFDYRGKLRDDKWEKNLATEIVSTYKKMLKRGKVESFGENWLSEG